MKLFPGKIQFNASGNKVLNKILTAIAAAAVTAGATASATCAVAVSQENLYSCD